MSWYSFFKYSLVRPFVKLAYKAKAVGTENIPSSGGAIIACNHTSATETYMMPALIKRPVTYPAKRELFIPGKGLKGIPQTVIAWAVKAVGQVPLDRTGGRAALDALGPVLQVLKDGGIAGIYPEGTRSVDGRLYKGKTGVARLALAANVPVVPCAITHNEITGKLFGAIPMADHPVVTFGRPLDFSRYAGCQDDRAVIRWVTDEIMNAIMELSGQTYVDAYGTSIKYGGMTVEEADARVAARPGLGLAVPEPCGAASD